MRETSTAHEVTYCTEVNSAFFSPLPPLPWCLWTSRATLCTSFAVHTRRIPLVRELPRETRRGSCARGCA
jgi:hypothetical protein